MIRRILGISLVTVVLLGASPMGVLAYNSYSKLRTMPHFLQDSLEHGEVDELTLNFLRQRINNATKRATLLDTVDMKRVTSLPLISIPQYVKGALAGLHVQENTGEPGAVSNLVWRGLTAPLFSNKDLNAVQPAVYVNGIPISQDHAFTYDIQKYAYNRLGPATDLLAGIDVNNIESIEIIKDPVSLAKLGPLAANGAIWVRTKLAKSGERQISVNSYYGLVQKSKVSPMNADYENKFRTPFYEKFGNNDNQLTYPGFLADSTNSNYYGASDWADLYYKNAPIYNVDLSITGGSDRANFRFFGAHAKSASNSDDAKFQRYNASFNINMAPFSWFTVSTIFNATRIDRQRNRSLRDRFAETGYLPDLSTPIAPSKNVYGAYLNQFKDALDDNFTNIIQAALTFDFKIYKTLNFSTRLNVDYNEGFRDAFYPSTLMETNNFVSNYYGYNQRLIFANNLTYNFDIDKKHVFNFDLGTTYQDDVNRFSYAKAYDGPNDFIKINVVDGDSSKDIYLMPQGGINVYRWNNKEQLRLFSTFAKVDYDYDNIFSLNAVLRYDGSSTVQMDNRWIFTPAFSGKWNLKNHLFADQEQVSNLTIRGGWARIAKLLTSSRYNTGPQYQTDLGWSGEVGMPSYNGFAAISRPYSNGWIGYNISWPYVDQTDVTVESSFFNNRLFANVSVYNKSANNQIIATPIPAEYGYTGQYLNGLGINNKGVEVTIGGQIIPTSKAFNWNSSINFAFNKNSLTSLPNGLQNLAVNDRLLSVGHAIDQYWIYENQGVYTSADQIPVDPKTNRVLNHEGVAFQVGDPIWKDQNGDFVIDAEDRVRKGNSMPKLTGSWMNQVSYKGFDLSAQFYFSVGQQVLNQRAASKFNFINNENINSLNSIREIFQWQQDVDIEKYPVYIPWSSVDPYRVEQDLFLEKASFVKLRALTLGYELSRIAGLKQRMKTLRRAYVYVSGTNLATITNFSGTDPELIDFNGTYSGYGLALAPTFTLGVKIDL